jgi:hypothetical protein
LVDIGKHLGMFKERVELTGKDGNAIEFEQKVKEDADAVASAIAGLAERARAASSGWRNSALSSRPSFATIGNFGRGPRSLNPKAIGERGWPWLVAASARLRSERSGSARG